MPKRRKKTISAEREVPIERYMPEGLDMEFSDSIVVQHSKNEFILSFLQTQHPLAVTRAELDAIKKVQSKVVARIVVTPKQMAANLAVLKKNLDKYIAKYGDIDTSELNITETDMSEDNIESEITHDSKTAGSDVTEGTEAE